MNSETKPISVVAVGVRPGEYDGILAEVPQDGRFQIVAFSDEGLEPRKLPSYPFPCCPDYNRLLQDVPVDLILIDGPLDLRPDFAVRGTGAGKHVVVARPLADTVADAYRMAKTARKNEALLTSAMPERADLLFRKVRDAVVSGLLGDLFSIEHRVCLDLPIDELPEEGLLVEHGVDLIDRVLLLLDSEVKDVRAFTRDVTEDVDCHFRVELTLRTGGWAAIEMVVAPAPPAPAWRLVGSRGSLVGEGGKLVHYGAEGTQELEGAYPDVEFWDNVHAALTAGAELEVQPHQIVRAYRVHEVAIASLEGGEPLAV